MMIKYRQIINAMTLLDFRSFRKAAQAQNLSQPAFSRSIANLEDTLGVQLFYRHSKGVTPTVYGDILNKYGNRILTSVSDFESQVRLTQNFGMGELNIGLGPYVAEVSGHSAVGMLISKFPNIRCKIIESDWTEVERLILKHQIDIGLAEISLALLNVNLNVKPLCTHRFVLFCRSEHPLLKETMINRDDLVKYPLVLTPIPERLGTKFPGQLFPDKFSKNMLPSVEVQNTALSRKIVVESDAISAGLPVQIKRELSEGIFSIIPFYESWMISNYGFILAKDRAVLPSAEKYMEFVKDIEKNAEIENEALIKKYLHL